MNIVKFRALSPADRAYLTVRLLRRECSSLAKSRELTDDEVGRVTNKDMSALKNIKRRAK